MPYHILAFRALGRALLACSLCVLAFAFAMEAKMAWYGPAMGPTRDISSAKAMPADTQGLVSHAAQVAIPFPPESAQVWLAACAAILAFLSGVSEFRQLTRIALPVSSRQHFVPLLFFRPPPAI